MLTIFLAVFTAAAKNLLFSVLRFDFVITLVSFAAFVTAFFASGSIVIAAFDISPMVGIGLFVGMGGGAAGFGAPNIESEQFIVSDGHGIYHFLVGKSAESFRIDTYGNTLRERSDGNYEKSTDYEYE